METELILEDEFQEAPDASEEQPSLSPADFIAFVTQSINIAAELDESKLGEISQRVLSDYEIDKTSMEGWTARMEKGIELAALVKEEKTYPFPRAANVKYPLVTSAALQFNARAYPAIIPADQVVKTVVHGKDPGGEKAARADRVSSFMSFQLTSEIEEWEEETDKLLMTLPITGTMERKWWYDPVQKRPRCRMLEPGAFVVNSKVKTLSDAPRCTEELTLYPAEIKTRVMTGQFVEFDFGDDDDKQAPEEFIEQHCRIDLDEDGYEEPYIVTLHKESQTIVRIVADFEERDVTFEMTQEPVEIMAPAFDPMTGAQIMAPQITMQEVPSRVLSIRRGTYFVPFKFMPSIDGGYHGTGLGLLLSDISDTVNSIINMMLDAGHMASLGGGFIGSEFRIKGGSQRFNPGEWKLANETGTNIRESIVPLTFPGPDGTLFQLLGLMIEAGKEISSTKDIMTGDAQRQMTATTTLALIEQGMMVFSAAYKRIFRALHQEYRLLAKINAQTLEPERYNAFHDMMVAGEDGQMQQVMLDPAADFDLTDMDITPVADPRSVTNMQEMAKAELLQNMAAQGMINPAAAADRVLRAAQIPSLEELMMPPPDPMQEQMAQAQAMMGMEMMKADLTQKLVEIDLKLAQIESEKADAMKKVSEAEVAQTRLRFDEIKMMMEERRAAIDEILRTGMGGLAAQPDNGGGFAGGAGNVGPANGSSPAQLLGGEAMAGSGPAVFGPVARMA
jgi:chaperonin GroES